MLFNPAFKMKNHILIFLYALVIINYHTEDEYENICKSLAFFTFFHGSFHKSVTMALAENLGQSPWQLPKSGHMTLQTLSNHSFHGLSSASSKHFL